ncbi:MAG: hypothetical protein JWN49_451 [Parcubacteria group bacterium]|nr:hypothetical protein [Parcubacteria group bacterium]
MNIRTLVLTIIGVILLGAGSYGIIAATRHTAPIVEDTSVIDSMMATGTPSTASTSPVATTTPTTTITKVVKKPTVVTKPVTSVIVVPPPAQPAPTTPGEIAGYGNLTVSLIPLLTGGNVRASGVVPVSYLQVNNTGTTTVKLSGFKLKENGSAPDIAIIGLQTVDEKGGSRGSAGGSESTTPFVNGLTEAPTNAILAPGQMKLFTVKVQLSAKAGLYANTQIIISVTGLDATATSKGNFPIAGTTWTITP